MRAIIKVQTNVEPERLDSVLMEKNWWPSLPQNHELVQSKKQEIIDTIAKEDLILAESTYLYTIYDDGSKSWGIVSQPTEHGLTFRIKNPVSDRLKNASEKLVSDLQVIGGKRKRDSSINFEFHSRIDVLEPGSENHAYFGNVLSANRFFLAIQQRKIESYVGFGAVVISIILMAITYPTITNVLFGTPPPHPEVDAYRDWIIGFLERLGTSAIVTATVSLLDVLLHWLDLKRKSTVQWSI